MKSEDLMHDPLVADLAERRPLTWIRSGLPGARESIAASGIEERVVERAEERFRWSAPWLAQSFPETRRGRGIIESDLHRADTLQTDLNARTGTTVPGRLWLKRDDSLPVSGSIKARGGFHEVLEYAQAVAARHGLALDASEVFATSDFREIAREHSVVVGSTGNLGLSIGILGAALGFSTTVHMSADARGWKKALLRAHGVSVVEHSGAFDEAVAAGRESVDDERAHFVDDESSVSLFSGYAVAGSRLPGQLAEHGVRVDEEHPLVVYLPCGVGGGPGGVTYGLKRALGDSVRCVFVEPVDAPAMTLGVRTGLHGDISVQDIGLSGRTAADGLAVGRPSQFIGARLQQLMDGFATVDDDVMRAGVSLLERAEGILVEPSATAGLTVPWRMHAEASSRRAPSWAGSSDATHLVWLTGGSMVPEAEMRDYVADGAALSDTVSLVPDSSAPRTTPTPCPQGNRDGILS